MPPYLTVRDVAEAIALSDESVLALIRAKQLRAVNVGLGAVKPRWRVAEADLQSFLDSRAASPTPKPTRQRRRRRDPEVIEFFK